MNVVTFSEDEEMNNWTWHQITKIKQTTNDTMKLLRISPNKELTFALLALLKTFFAATSHLELIPMQCNTIRRFNELLSSDKSINAKWNNSTITHQMTWVLYENYEPVPWTCGCLGRLWAEDVSSSSMSLTALSCVSARHLLAVAPAAYARALSAPGCSPFFYTTAERSEWRWRSTETKRNWRSLYQEFHEPQNNNQCLPLNQGLAKSGPQEKSGLWAPSIQPAVAR